MPKESGRKGENNDADGNENIYDREICESGRFSIAAGRIGPHPEPH